MLKLFLSILYLSYSAFICAAEFSTSVVIHSEPIESSCGLKFEKISSETVCNLAFIIHPEVALDVKLSWNNQPEVKGSVISNSQRVMFRFYNRDNPEDEIGYVKFFVQSEKAEVIFNGMFISESWRGVGLQKTLFRFFLSFVEFQQWVISSTTIYKPLFAKMFLDFGFKPYSKAKPCLIDKNPTDEFINVYIEGFKFRPQLLESQKMRLLENPPDEFQKVYVYSRYAQPKEFKLKYSYHETFVFYQN